MTNNINHEIKTPVGIIRGYLESILGDPEMDDQTRTHFAHERMMTNVERLTSLLNDVSTMTRLENGADMIAVESVNMHDLVYQIEYDLPANNLAGKMEFSSTSRWTARSQATTACSTAWCADSSKFGSLFGRNRNTPQHDF